MNLIIYTATSQWLSHEIAQNSSVAYDSYVWQVIPFANADDMNDYIVQHELLPMNDAAEEEIENEIE